MHRPGALAHRPSGASTLEEARYQRGAGLPFPGPSIYPNCVDPESSARLLRTVGD